MTILTGHANHSGLTDTQICFADSDGDGTDFPGDGFSSPSYGPKTLRQGDGYLGIGSGGT